MEPKHSYRRRGTPDLPVATYIGIAGMNIKEFNKQDQHSDIEIVLQVAGTTTGEIGDQIITHQQGDIWIIPSETKHRRISVSDDAVVHRIVFSTEAIQMQPNHFFQKGFVAPLSDGRLELPASLQPGHPSYEAVRNALMDLDKCRIYEKNYKQHRLSVLMRICLAIMPYCKIKEDIVPSLSNLNHEGVKLCMRYIHNHYAQKITLDEIAQYCHLHPNRLCAVFKKHTGQSVFEYLTKIRIETAAGFLRREDLPVSKVAELVGFKTECLFYKKFKEIMGVTPKEYAKSK